MEQLPENNLNLKRETDEKINESVKIQAEYLNNLENYFKDIIEKKRLPESSLEPIFDESGKPPAFIKRLHRPPERKTQRIKKDEDGKIKYYSKYHFSQEGYHRLWLVVDFDDTLNKTSSYNQDIKEDICKLTGMTSETFDQLYNKNKKENQSGKKPLDFHGLIAEIKAQFPQYEKEIDNIVENRMGSNEYLDQSMRRILMVIRSSGVPIRVSILTFGNIKYQEERINQTDLGDIVDDVIYTERDKAETLEKLINLDYRGGIKHPFIMTIDDSSEQINDLDKLPLKTECVNVHFRNPQAKRFKDDPNVRNISILEENQSEAAVNLYKLIKVCLKDEIQLTKQNIYKTLNNKDFNKMYSETTNDAAESLGFGDLFKNETNVTYEKRLNEDIVRQSDYLKRGQTEHSEEIIGKNGQLLEIKPFGSSHSPISREEFIRNVNI